MLFITVEHAERGNLFNFYQGQISVIIDWIQMDWLEPPLSHLTWQTAQLLYILCRNTIKLKLQKFARSEVKLYFVVLNLNRIFPANFN